MITDYGLPAFFQDFEDISLIVLGRLATTGGLCISSLSRVPSDAWKRLIFLVVPELRVPIYQNASIL